MKVELRIPSTIRAEALKDLARQHAFAFERVGFLAATTTLLGLDHHLVLITDYHPVPDDHYIDDPSVGACIGGAAIRAAMQRVIDEGKGQLHVHLHDHAGPTGPSFTDRKGLPPVVRSLATVGPNQASGYLLFSSDSAWAELRVPGVAAPVLATKITSVGFPLLFLK
ncbi:MAG: hypothetical protein Q8N18_13635 [Opitutaceae bacterium]|nr:hypothetical protein [Opitutaceae bacterium]